MNKGIPTMRGGVRFRSRLEARWAAFFDLLGWRWAYEPIDLDGWIPDFALLLNEPLYVEVKPSLTLDALKADAAKALRHNCGQSGPLLLGAVVEIDRYFNEAVIGLLGIPEYSPSVTWGNWKYAPTDAAIVGRCAMANHWSLTSCREDYVCRVCGEESVIVGGREEALRLWHTAGNSVQWMARA